MLNCKKIFIYIVFIFFAMFLAGCSFFEATKIQFTVVFNSMGGTEVESVLVGKGDKVPIPSLSEKEGYTLEGWYTSLDGGVTLDEKWSFLNSEVISNITLYAKWNINDYSIIFVFDEIEDTVSITQEYDSLINFPQLPIKYGYVFNGWYTDEERMVLFDSDTMPAENITLYAGWIIVEENELTLVIHYLRFNEDYTNWNIWMWSHSPSYPGAQYDFTNDDGSWKVLYLDLLETNLAWANNIGLSIRRGDWAEKDISKDRFIDLSSYSSGSEVHVYLVQGIDDIFFSYDDVKQYDILENLNKDYYATGNFNGWDTLITGQMDSISRYDQRVNSIIDELEGVKYLYILEITLSAMSSGWDVTYKIDGIVQTFDGNLTVKVIRTTAEDPDSRDFWAQSPESGAIINLTPGTLYIPTYMEDNIDQAGGWNDMPVAFEAGTYYIIFAEFEDSKAMGLIKVN